MPPHDLAVRRRLAAFLLAVLIVLLGCGGQALDQASRSYRQHKDCASLQAISKCLRSGMLRREVEGLLGEPDYSPIEGQYYYTSSQSADSGQQAALTLVVDYRSKQGAPTDALHTFWLGAVGE